MLYVNIVLLLVFFGCFAFLFKGGLWNNTLTLVNVIVAALLATNYFEPLADWMEGQEPSLTYAYDFLALWLVFAVVMSLLRLATDYMSPVKVKFFKPLDVAGGCLMALWVGWVVVCFTTMTLHTAPLARNFLRGQFQEKPETKMFFSLAPDRKWLAWVHRESQGSLSRFSYTWPFDARGDFVIRYGNRRAQFEKQLNFATPKGGARPAGNPLPPQ